MVGLRILGLLGNHMFQYAFIQSVSKKLNTPFFIIYGKARMNRPRLYHYFIFENHNAFKNFIYNKIQSIKEYIKIESSNQPEDELLKIKNHAIYEGFVQSEKYFSFIDQDVQGMFRIKKKYTRQFNQKYQSLFQKNKTLVVHIRQGDYSSMGSEDLGGTDLRLPLSYYHHALSQLIDLHSYKIIFISDDIDYCREHFREYKNALFETNSEIVDLQLIINADAAIISNSTFGWWGAFLNHKNHKQIFAPKYWLGFKVKKEYPAGITSVKDWRWLEV